MKPSLIILFVFALFMGCANPSIEQRLLTLMDQQYYEPAEKRAALSTRLEDVGLVDEIDFIDFKVNLEAEFGVKISDKVLYSFTNLEQVVGYLGKLEKE